MDRTNTKDSLEINDVLYLMLTARIDTENENKFGRVRELKGFLLDL